MNTPAHIFLNLGILGNRIKPELAGVIILGSLTPDVPAFIFYFYEKVILQTPESIIWSVKYHQVYWNYTFDSFHSIPVSFIAALVLFLLHKKWLVYFFTAIFLHALLDFPLHNQDAHRHFLPFTDSTAPYPIGITDITAVL